MPLVVNEIGQNQRVSVLILKLHFVGAPIDNLPLFQQNSKLPRFATI